ncbi:TPA: HNH endonuclease [Serratia marcescens]|uniref:HNH endonuclease n=1 Tax=Serratia sp. 506_PEND TaxID=1572666 RepID=UPI000949A759|nr:hypothetical protein [Serratia sp. 506_PEND]
MNKLPRPEFRDYVAIGKLTKNKRLKDYVLLSTQTSNLINAYRIYQRNGGFLLNRPYPPLLADVKSSLINYYKAPPVSHSIIKKLRDENSTSLCPMCGSMHRGTLDHVLPKAIWPEFSLLTRNLVPACKCNQMKSAVLGLNKNHRMLHPYYDAILKERLVKAGFKNLGEFPDISLEITKDNTHPFYDSIVYHVNNVVLKNDILGYLSKRWESFYLYPRMVVRGIGPHLKNTRDISKVLIDEVRLLDDCHGGRNNWNSVFAAGLLTAEVVNWLWLELKNPNRDVNGKLV